MKASNLQNDSYELRFRPEELYQYQFSFAGKDFSLFQVIKEFAFDFEQAPRQEILPGIWLTDLNGRFRPFSLLHSPVDLLMPRIRGYRFHLEVHNRRNAYAFPSVVTFTKPVPDPVPRPETAGKVLLDPALVACSDTMGSGPSRCAVWNCFARLGLYDMFSYSYSMFSLGELIENVTKHHRLLWLCEKQDNCRELLEKFRTGRYDTTDEEAPIRLSYTAGAYHVSDGKHRLCVARRFQIARVPVFLTVREASDPTRRDETPVSVPSRHSTPCKPILEAYRKILRTVPLTEEQGQYLLKTPLEDLDLVGYLESVFGKPFEQMPELWS